MATMTMYQGATGRRGPALELAIGTGRIALPLAERGMLVEGIDISAATLAELEAERGGVWNRRPSDATSSMHVSVCGRWVERIAR